MVLHVLPYYPGSEAAFDIDADCTDAPLLTGA